MDDAAHSRELRRQQRFKTRDRVFAVLYTDVLLLGKVVDVSLKGLAFQYVTLPRGMENGPKVWLILKSLKTVSPGIGESILLSCVRLEVPLEVRFSYSYQLRRCGIHFGDLSRNNVRRCVAHRAC